MSAESFSEPAPIDMASVSTTINDSFCSGIAAQPMGDEEMGLDSLTITKGDATKTHVYYVVVERYRTVDGLRNHQKQFRKDSNGDYASLLGNLGFFSQYRVYKSEQRKTVFSIIP